VRAPCIFALQAAPGDSPAPKTQSVKVARSWALKSRSLRDAQAFQPELCLGVSVLSTTTTLLVRMPVADGSKLTSNVQL